MFLEISQNSHEITSACNFIKKETLAQVFSREFCKISKNTFIIDASDMIKKARIWETTTLKNVNLLQSIIDIFINIIHISNFWCIAKYWKILKRQIFIMVVYWF